MTGGSQATACPQAEATGAAAGVRGPAPDPVDPVLDLASGEGNGPSAAKAVETETQKNGATAHETSKTKSRLFTSSSGIDEGKRRQQGW
jgi:hypothetical protein